MNFCPRCGTKINPTKRFCKECGLDLMAYKKKLDKIAANADAEADTPEILNLPEIEPKNIPVSEPEINAEKQTAVKSETESKKILVRRPENRTENHSVAEVKVEPEKISVREPETNTENQPAVKSETESKKLLVRRPENRTEDHSVAEVKVETEKISVREPETKAENQPAVKSETESKKLLVRRPENRTENHSAAEVKVEPEKISIREPETNAENQTAVKSENESKKILVRRPENRTENHSAVEVKVEPEKISIREPEDNTENQTAVKSETESKKILVRRPETEKEPKIIPVVQDTTTTDTKINIKETSENDSTNFEGYNNAIEKFKSSGRNIKDLSAAEWLNAGYQAYLDKDYQSALKMFANSANLGNADALCWQGRIYDTLEEDGGEKDAVKAFDLYQKAADAGSIFAMHRCGIHYILGDSVPKDTETGMALIKKAADNYYKFAYSVLANESDERSKRFLYAKKFIATNDINAKSYFGFLMTPELAFAAATNSKDKTATFPFFDYDLTFTDTTALMTSCSASFTIIPQIFVPRFQNFYKNSGKIENVINEVEKIGNDMLVKIAENPSIVGLCQNLVKNDITAKDLVFRNANNLTDIKGESLSQSFAVSPAKIWSCFVKNIRKQYNKFKEKSFDSYDNPESKSNTNAEDERDSKISWQDVGGYDFVNRIFNVVKAGILGDNYRDFNSVDDIFERMFKAIDFEKVYKDSHMCDAYSIGLMISIETLKFRTLSIIGFNNQLENFEKSEKIIKNLKKCNVSDSEIKEQIRDAILLSPINFNVYEYALRRLGDPEGDLEYLALSMSQEYEGKFSEAKKKILFERLENNPNISNTFKDILFNDSDPVEGLLQENFSTLKQDFKNMLHEAARLQVPTVGDNKFCRIFDIYKTVIKSLKADKNSDSRIQTFEYADENFQSFDIEEGVTEIGGYSFANCQQLEEINFPSTLKKIDAGAFYNCSFATIELPYGVEEISINLSNQYSTVDTIVYLPNSLQRITGNYIVTSNHTKFVFDTEAMPFIKDYFKYTCRYDELVSVLTEEEAKKNYADKNLNTNAGVLESGIFNNKEIFSNDEFTVTANFARYVQESCFKDSNVKEINFGANLREIKSFAFADCNNLKNLILPAGTEYLGDSICADCKNLESLTIPDTVKFIGENILSGTNAVVHCSPNSYAAEYCRKNNIPLQHENDTPVKISKVSILKENKEISVPVEEDEPPIIAVNSKKITSKKDLLLFREDLFEKYGNLRCIYFPNKGQKAVDKMKNILITYAKDAKNEVVIFFYDDTIFGSATDGFIVTDKAIYYHNSSDDDNVKYRIPFNEIATISTSENHIVILDSLYEYEISTKFVDAQQNEQMARILQEIRNALMG